MYAIPLPAPQSKTLLFNSHREGQVLLSHYCKSFFKKAQLVPQPGLLPHLPLGLWAELKDTSQTTVLVLAAPPRPLQNTPTHGNQGFPGPHAGPSVWGLLWFTTAHDSGHKPFCCWCGSVGRFHALA